MASARGRRRVPKRYTELEILSHRSRIFGGLSSDSTPAASREIGSIVSGFDDLQLSAALGAIRNTWPNLGCQSQNLREIGH
jgi:hypothetical protein